MLSQGGHVETMSEFPHDDFAKEYLTELLSNIGTAVPNKVIKSERREGDLWFERDTKLTIVTQRKKLGLMGQLLRRDSLIEVFRNPATAMEIRACRGKLTDIEWEMAREAKRKKETLTEDMLPDLWFIMPTASEEILQGFGLRKSRISGVYRWPKLDRTGLIVVHQLPMTEETLWIRLLGRNGNQARAIHELVTLEGKLEGKLEAAIGLLREGMTPEMIARALGLPIESIENLRPRL